MQLVYADAHGASSDSCNTSNIAATSAWWVRLRHTASRVSSGRAVWRGDACIRVDDDLQQRPPRRGVLGRDKAWSTSGGDGREASRTQRTRSHGKREHSRTKALPG
jgi:hypothetical protein